MPVLVEATRLTSDLSLAGLLPEYRAMPCSRMEMLALVQRGVEQGDGIGMADSVSLRINGKADASTGIDLCTQLLSAHLPLLAKPDSKDVFILGLGSGVSGGAAIAHPITNLVIAENCAPVFRATRYFDHWNRGVLTNPVVRPWLEDARTVLKLSPKTYDVIITEPSNPWTVGIGSVFTLEFYELAAKRLKPGGMILQWFHIYENNDALVVLVLRTVNRVFPHMEIWDCGAGDVLIMASQQPWDSSPEALRVGFSRPEVKKDMADAQNAGVNSTPSFFINGIPVVGAQGYQAFSDVIDRELAKGKK